MNTAATKIVDQLDWHTKTTAKGEPCDVCGCATARKGATHRGLRAGEWRPAGAVYVVSRSVCFGTTREETFIAE